MSLITNTTKPINYSTAAYINGQSSFATSNRRDDVFMSMTERDAIISSGIVEKVIKECIHRSLTPAGRKIYEDGMLTASGEYVKASIEQEWGCEVYSFNTHTLLRFKTVDNALLFKMKYDGASA